MKTALSAVAISLAFLAPAQAQHHGHRHFGHHHAPRVVHHHGGWVAPLIVGGVLTYVLTNRPVQAEPAPPVVVVPQSPNGQIILQNTGVVCPEGTAPFFNIRADRYGRTYYEFDTCK